MKRPAKIALGVATLATLVWSILALVHLSGLLLQVLRTGRISQAWLEELTSQAPMQAIGGGAMLALMVLYLMHCARNRSLSQGSRAAWLLALAIGGTFVMPVYFALRIWPERQPPPLPPGAARR